MSEYISGPMGSFSQREPRDPAVERQSALDALPARAVELVVAGVDPEVVTSIWFEAATPEEGLRQLGGFCVACLRGEHTTAAEGDGQPIPYGMDWSPVPELPDPDPATFETFTLPEQRDSTEQAKPRRRHAAPPRTLGRRVMDVVGALDAMVAHPSGNHSAGGVAVARAQRVIEQGDYPQAA